MAQRGPADGPFRWQPPAAATGPQAGPTGPQPGPTGPQAGPTGPQAGPTGPQAGPTGPQAGPTGPQAGPTGPQQGPAGPQLPPGSVGYLAEPGRPGAPWGGRGPAPDLGGHLGYAQAANEPGHADAGGSGRRGGPDQGAEDDQEADEGGFIPGFDDSQGSRRDRARRPRRRVGRVLAPMLAIALLCLVGAGGYYAWQKLRSPDYAGSGTGEITVQVAAGDSAISLAPRLVRLGVVASTNAFISAAKKSSNPTGLEPGTFRLRRHMSAASAYALLLNPKSRIQTTVAIPDGLRLTKILTMLGATTRWQAGAYASAIKDTAALGLPAYAHGNPEGYLYPATYNIQPGTSALGVLQAMVQRFNQEAVSVNLGAMAGPGRLTPGQVVTVASLLEAEGGSAADYPKIARVIYNRLNQKWDLGLDSTVLYALHRFGFFLTETQLHVNSPYNTFIHPGLPPGPIDSPGQAAIEAALHPAAGNWMYFVTVNPKTGLTKFTNSKTQFDQDVAECRANKAC